MVGAGALVGLLFGITSPAGKAGTIVVVGLLMIIYVVVGGMKGTTWVQIVKAVLLMTGAALVTVLVLAHFGFNLSSLLGNAAQQSGKGQAFLEPGLKYGVEAKGLAGKLDFISPRPGPGAGHGRPAAHPDPLLHRADRQGRPQVGHLGASGSSASST